MDALTCLKKLEYVGVLAFATVDKNGAPQIRNISAIHYEPDRMIFFTAKGKAFCEELLTDGRVQVLGYTRYKEMIRLSAKAVSVPEDEQEKWIDTIFAEQPYLSNVYPGDTRKLAGIVFEIRDAEIEYFNLGVNPIFRESYTICHFRKMYRLRKVFEQLPPAVHRAGDTLPYSAESLLTLRKLLCGLPGKGDRKAGITWRRLPWTQCGNTKGTQR